jgi:FMN phosphatase YigB (HAD superfamily)
MNQIEKDKTSAPPFIELLDEEEIEEVIFDLDGTLLKTDEHFDELKERLGIELSAHFESISPHYFLCDEITRQIAKQMTELYYENNRHPVLLDELYMQALVRYFEYIGQEQLTDQMKEIIKDYAQECYSNSPEACEGVVEILKVIEDSGRGILFHSHAQDSWTGIKAEYLFKSAELGNIGYLATPIDQKKDLKSWLKAIAMTKSKPEHILTVGDNFQADVLPSIQAGCKNVVWINRLDKKFPKDFQLPKGVNLYVIEDISQLRLLTVNSRVTV